MHANYRQNNTVPVMQNWTVSHDLSEIILICWFAAQETCIIIIINAENSCAALYFCVKIFFSKITGWIESSKQQQQL